MIVTVRTTVDVYVEAGDAGSSVVAFKCARDILRDAGVTVQGSMDMIPGPSLAAPPTTGEGVQLRLDLEPRGPWVKPTWPGNW